MTELTVFDPNLFPNVSLKDKKLLPDKPGVYFVYWGERLLYVGMAGSLRSRHTRHERSWQFEQFEGAKIGFILKQSRFDRLHQLESDAIQALHPYLNYYNIPKSVKNIPSTKMFWDYCDLMDGIDTVPDISAV